jgi:hypothetical protein
LFHVKNCPFSALRFPAFLARRIPDRVNKFTIGTTTRDLGALLNVDTTEDAGIVLQFERGRLDLSGADPMVETLAAVVDETDFA